MKNINGDEITLELIVTSVIGAVVVGMCVVVVIAPILLVAKWIF